MNGYGERTWETGQTMLDMFAYKVGCDIAQSRPPFYSLIVAAMLGADTQNLAALTAAFPSVAADLRHYEDGGISPRSGQVLPPGVDPGR